MFRLILSLTIVALLVYYYPLYRRNSDLLNILMKDFRMYLRQIRLALTTEPDASRIAVANRLRRAFLSATGILFVFMAITGFVPVLLFGIHLSGWMLIFHVTAAPLFAISLTMTALFYANFKLFRPADLEFLTGNSQKKDRRATMQYWSRLSFWLFLLVSVPAVGSVVLSMYPFFGTGGQHSLLGLHQYSVLILFIIISVFVRKRLEMGE